MKLNKCLLIAMHSLLALYSGQLYANTYYVDGGLGIDANSCGASQAPCSSINYAGGLMSAGDTMIVMEGVYEEAIDQNTIPRGNASQYTTIKGNSYGGVVITGDLSVVGDLNHYMKFENLKFHSDHGRNFTGHYIKVIKTIFQNGPASGKYNKIITVGSNDHSNSYILFEDVVAFGTGGRYKLQFYRVDNGICRRCIIRGDGGWRVGEGSIGRPEGGMIAYECNNFEFQNPMVFDSIYRSDEEKLGNVIFNSHIAVSNNVVRGGIVFNNEATSVSFEGNGAIQDGYVEDTVMVNNRHGIISNMALGLSLNINNSVILNNLMDGASNFGDGSVSVSNSIIFGNGRNAVTGVSTSNVVTSDPFSNGYKYLPRIEAESNLSAAGVGLKIQKIGRNGSLYGDAGYKEVQAQDLFPLGYDVALKSHMCNHSDLSLAGRTGSAQPGLCVSGKTISSYIWEYLGNSCPSGVCSASILSAPSPPGSVKVSAN